MPNPKIYTIDPSLTEEQVAVTFAMTSRSPEPFDEIAKQVSETRAAEFHEKWVIGYGHSSVAEHAIIHMAFENISRIAADVIEENRLASYTEKSSRFQIIDSRDYHIPEELDACPALRTNYTETMNAIFDAYSSSAASLLDTESAATLSQGGSSQQSVPTAAVRRAVMDQVRALLPAAVLTNVGMTANARTFEYAISKLLSDPLRECQFIGEWTKSEASEQVPTLLKYAKHNPVINRYRSADLNQPYVPITNHDSAELVWHTDNAMIPLASTLGLDYDSFSDLSNIYHSEFNDKVWEAIGEIVRDRGEYDPLPRGFELVSYIFLLTMDYGALREFRRHRMMTPISEWLTTKHGYQIPEMFDRSNELSNMFHHVMDLSDRLYDALHQEFGPAVAQYAVTHAHQQGITVGMNARELAEFLRLRTSERAHASIRKPALAMRDEVRQVHPELMKLIEV